MTPQDERWELMAKWLVVHRQAMLKLAKSHVTCPMAAEDIVQDATIVALRRGGSLKNWASVRSWLLRITASVARRSIAKRARRRNLRAKHFAAAVPPVDPLAPSSEPDRRIGMVMDALESLPELQQRTMRCLLDGLSYKETAAKLDKTVGAVRMLRQRAVGNLQKALRPPRQVHPGTDPPESDIQPTDRRRRHD